METASKITGTLRQVGGHYLLTDETTNVTAEVAGEGLSKELGNRIEVTGGMDPDGDSGYGRLAVHSSDGGEAPVGRAQLLEVMGAAAAGKGGAVWEEQRLERTALAITATTIAIVGGVAVAGTVGGLAAAGTFSGSSSISR